MNEEELNQVLKRHSVSACLSFFEGADETQRSALANCAIAWLREYEKTSYLEFLEPIRIAVISTCTMGQMRKFGKNCIPEPAFALSVFKERRPDWASEWLEFVGSKSPEKYPAMLSLFAKASLIPRPSSSEYFIEALCMLAKSDKPVSKGLKEDEGLLQGWRLFFQNTEVLELIVENAHRVLSTSGKIRFCAHSSMPETWMQAFLKLADDGVLSKDELVDVSLEALRRSEIKEVSEWLRNLLTAIALPLDDNLRRKKAYTRLLSATNQATVEWSLEVLNQMVNTKALTVLDLDPDVREMFLATGKSNPLRGLKLLKAIAKVRKDDSGQAALIAVSALQHASADVGVKAMDLIEHCGSRDDTDLVQSLQSQIASLTGSVKEKALQWLAPIRVGRKEVGLDGVDADASIEPLLEPAKSIAPDLYLAAGIEEAQTFFRNGGTELGALALDANFPRLSSASILQPLHNIDDLIYVFLRILEGTSTGDEIELAIDGVARLCDQRPADFDRRTAPLRKRAIEILTPNQSREHVWLPRPFYGNQHITDIAALIFAWSDGILLAPKPGSLPTKVFYEAPWGTWSTSLKEGPYLLLFFSTRILEIAKGVANRKSLQLLSIPTHKGGWIDPLVLVERLKQLDSSGEQTYPSDLIQSLLRLAPDRRSEALDKLQGLAIKNLSAVRYALGDEIEPDALSLELLIAATGARHSKDSDLKLSVQISICKPPKILDIGVRATAIDNIMASWLNWGEPEEGSATVVAPSPESVALSPLLLIDKRKLNPTIGSGSDVPIWDALVWPQARQSYFAREARIVFNHLESLSKEIYLSQWEPLFDPDVLAQGTACWLIALALATKNPTPARMALDALIQAVYDSRIDGSGFGHVIADLIHNNLSASSRWMPAFQETARTSPVHLVFMCSALDRALAGLSNFHGKPPLKLIELYYELSVEAGQAVKNPGARDYLNALAAAGGKAQKLTQALLKLKADPERKVEREAALMALEKRIERAERWQRSLTENVKLAHMSVSRG